ncbi:TetR/AcrR family transcriptional regulator [Mucilaginibacter sp. SMC90]|uniref:TetR/AcrR family transcriptional regulator n=1 Tax=Mucilaginibacter sp. SMC90 TaxID=2929803 RepID=UPI001FB1C9DD|nr:TetR/AcrR family transcriptional regulator [Mucilaginibacter sp. SMC90]UOE50299.1 TetR/AcrR family transcriptional regulator [Mucilaginibacter sp. SMC90]
MRTQKVNPENVDLKLFETFSELGYDGASMEALAKATGLKKASLYHRFPNGKKEMAKHALEIVEQWILQHIVAESANKNIPAAARLKKMIASVDELYNGGANNCLLRTLSVGTDASAFKTGVTNCFNLLADGFADVAVDMGISPDRAKQNAKLINQTIQGSLVLTGATGDNNYFKNSLEKIQQLLTT